MAGQDTGVVGIGLCLLKGGEGVTDKELQQLKNDIKAEVLKEITGKDYKAVNSKSGVFDKVRDKYRMPLREKYGVYHFDQVWVHIRRLSCYMAGVKYVRDLTPSKEMIAAEIAERLCNMAVEDRE